MRFEKTRGLFLALAFTFGATAAACGGGDDDDGTVEHDAAPTEEMDGGGDGPRTPPAMIKCGAATHAPRCPSATQICVLDAADADNGECVDLPASCDTTWLCETCSGACTAGTCSDSANAGEVICS